MYLHFISSAEIQGCIAQVYTVYRGHPSNVALVHISVVILQSHLSAFGVLLQQQFTFVSVNYISSTHSNRKGSTCSASGGKGCIVQPLVIHVPMLSRYSASHKNQASCAWEPPGT